MKEKEKKQKVKDMRPFAKRHPKWNFLFGLLVILFLLVIGGAIVYFTIKYIGVGISKFTDWLSEISSKLDAVIIVALITGAASIVSVVISSVASKRIEYTKQRQEYLAQKREKSYGEFVDMVYKIKDYGKNPAAYSIEEMIKDIMSFSQELTLWGSKPVADKWAKFRLNGADPDFAYKNIWLLEEIMNDMRKDLGVKKLKKGKLLSFFVNDVDKAMKEKK